MPRIQKAFDRRFLDLFAELGARDRDKGLAWIHHKAEQLVQSANSASPSSTATPTLSHAYTEIAIAILNRTRPFRERRHPSDHTRPPRVHCDAGLGGLARWLRAVGCEASWRQDITDAELVRETQQHGGILLTTDSLLLDRRPIVRGEIRALWVPPTLTMLEQLRYVRAELDLPETDESRCMRCGGELIQVNKEQVRDRIPPRTYKWLDEFFECAACHQLFWNGTHWQRIQSKVKVVSGK
jgi:uncharacterized protein